MFESIQITLDPANLVAVAISLFAIGLSVWQISLNRPRIRVFATEDYIEEGIPGVRWLLVEVVNFGAHPTGLKQLTVCTFTNQFDWIPKRSKRVPEFHLPFGWSRERHGNPPIALAPGGLLSFTFQISPNSGLEEALKVRHRRLAVMHSWAERAKFVKIHRMPAATAL